MGFRNDGTERHDVTPSASAGRRDAGSGRSQGDGPPWPYRFLGAVLVVSSLIVALFVSHAGAALSNGSVTIKIASSGAVATSPIADGQLVDVVVGTEFDLQCSSLSAAGFPSGAVPIKVLECADLKGLAANLPKVPTDCEPATIRAVSGSAVEEDGSMLVRGYTIFALPDPADLGDSNGTVCDNTSTSACSASSPIRTILPNRISSRPRSRSRRRDYPTSAGHAH